MSATYEDAVDIAAKGAIVVIVDPDDIAVADERLLVIEAISLHDDGCIEDVLEDIIDRALQLGKCPSGLTRADLIEGLASIFRLAS